MSEGNTLFFVLLFIRERFWFAKVRILTEKQV